jgi:hypothetical protein
MKVRYKKRGIVFGMKDRWRDARSPKTNNQFRLELEIFAAPPQKLSETRHTKTYIRDQYQGMPSSGLLKILHVD